MIRFSKISFNYHNLLDYVVSRTKSILWFLGKNAFYIIIIAVIFCIAWGAFLFYKYVFLVKMEDPISVSSPVKFQKDIYDSVLKEQQKREDNFNKSSDQNYLNPFK